MLPGLPGEGPTSSDYETIARILPEYCQNIASPRPGEKYGPIDLTLINIGAYNFYPMSPRKDKSIYHTNPEEALEIGKDLKSKKLIGMHWGTVVLSLEPTLEPPKRFKNSAKQYGYEPNDAIIFKIGQVEPLENIIK